MTDTAERPRILIIDDDQVNTQLLMDILGDAYRYSIALSGDQGLQLAQTAGPELILLDVLMPGLDGYEVCRRLLENEKTCDIPVIFITTLDQLENELRGFSLGAVDYIAKPFRVPIVRARVKSHIELRQARLKLQQQNELLQENMLLREDVERIVHHDLKSPLTTILGVPQLLAAKLKLTPRQAELLKSVEEAGLLIMSMITLSQEVYKIEQGTFHLQPEDVELVRLISMVRKQLRMKSLQKNVQIVEFLDGKPLESGQIVLIQGEELLWYAILDNLISNALEASPKNQNVEIAYAIAGEELQITIHNKGVVPKAIRERFFEKYVTFGKEKGTGLGTYAAKLFVEAQGGRIEMHSGQNQGTTLTIRVRHSQDSYSPYGK